MSVHGSGLAVHKLEASRLVIVSEAERSLESAELDKGGKIERNAVRTGELVE